MASRTGSADGDRGRLILAGLLVALTTIMLLIATLLEKEFERSRELAVALEQTHAVRSRLGTVLSLHQDIEVGQRGYLLTRDRRFLEPFVSSRRRVHGELEELDRALEDTSPHRRSIATLQALSQAKLRFSEYTIALAENPERASAAVASGRGKALMDAIRRQIASIDADERALLQQRSAASFRAQASAKRLAYGLLILLAALLGVSAVVITRAWAAQRRLVDQARDSATRQRAILENTKDAILSLNPSGSIESMNPAAAAMFGYEPHELVRRDISLLFEIAPETVQGAETFLKRLRLDAHEGRGRVIEIGARRKDGALIPTEVAVSQMELPSGLYAVAVVRDISERKRIDRMKTEFVATVSHELRTPLTSISGSLGLLQGGAAGALPDRAARLVSIANANCERLVRLINDILDIEKIESGQVQFDRKPVDLCELVGRCVDANQGFAATYGVTLDLEAAERTAVTVGDADRITQVITNLLSNAIKFSPTGGSVTVRLTQHQRCWRVSVKDNGPGIPEAFRARMFEKFAQNDSSDSRSKGGTGLGLHIAREIAVRLGGMLSFESELGCGTSFHFDLPGVESVGTCTSRDAPAGPLPRILHLEDDVDVTRVVAEAFEGKAVVVPAHSLAHARQLLGRNRFDLLILDVGLAEGSGLDMLPEPGARPPAILFSAQDVAQADAARAAAVLIKSRSSVAGLVSTAERLLSLKEAA